MALRGWAITRIPPKASSRYGDRVGPLSLVCVSDVVLQEDFVGCARSRLSEGQLLALKL
ncbi:MAG TPA: hypothetical protein PKO24_01510 [Methanomassiliicoccales archaeon]|jgi:hypothetical protein|nr:hypothetical protein [Methanomassiliicoccales archaeon]MCE5260852.1 hypothetical protein [Euryarchaeota archaeon]HOE52292.1 hypothetical protein [Methanomassiliicoccales archaeon]HOO04336.1 hypothetical protein [Methanomassiliicoccales archaeon]HQM66751.1 hypothetical protein [Methanomassiliicoccales archaeon]